MKVKSFFTYLLLVAISIGFVTCRSPEVISGPETITISSILVPAPVASAIPERTIASTEQFTGTVGWSPNNPRFTSETVYTATIRLTAADGFTFDGLPPDFFSIDHTTSVVFDADRGIVTAVFPPTGYTPITISEVGVAAPFIWRTPTERVVYTPQFTGTVEWYPNDAMFAPGTAYTATITLTPRSGFAFQGIEANQFTVAGATTATNAAGSGVITAEFPAIEGRTFPSIHLSIPREFSNTNPGSPYAICRNNWRASNIHVFHQFDQSFSYGLNVAGQVRGRGNSTWNAMGSKRPYRFRFGSNVATWQPMLGSDYAARVWILLANAIDYTLMRNFSAYYLASNLDGLYWTPSQNFVHLYLGPNREYRGVYMLTDERDPLTVGGIPQPGRTMVTFNTDPTLSEYIIEWCRHPRSAGDEYFVIQVGGGIPGGPGNNGTNVPFDVRFPDPLSTAHRNFARDFTRDVSMAIQSRYWSRIEPLIDVASFVDMYLMHELFKNRDTFFSSLFFQIHQQTPGVSSPIMVAGPLWDFDQSSGSVRDGDYTESPIGAYAITNAWFWNLMRTPEFRALVSARWFEIRDNQVRQMIDKIHYMTTTYEACFLRNFTVPGSVQPGDNLWRTPPNIRLITTHQGQVAHLVWWLEQRISWMNGWVRSPNLNSL